MVALYILLCMLIGYLLGSIPFGLLFTKIFLKKDVRDIGSKSTGATNVFRMNKWLAVLTVICDFLKVWGAIYLVGYLALKLDIIPVQYNFAFYAVLTGVFAVIGHNFPVWLGFKGGKGFASTLAVLSFFAFNAFLILIGLWILLFLIFGYSSLAGLTVLILMPFVLLFLGFPVFIYMSFAFLTLLGIYMHRPNILRLLKGQEDKTRPFGNKKNKKK